MPTTPVPALAAAAPSPTPSRRLSAPLARACSFPVLLVALLAITTFLLARTHLPDPDLWWHLRNGKQTLAQHAPPRVDTYSFTVAHQPWMDPEWLAELPWTLAWRAGGLACVQWLMLALLEALVVGMAGLAWQRSRNIKAATVAAVLGALLASVNFGPRTILFGYLCLLVLLALLERQRQSGRAPLWLLPPLFCLWINLHGSWSLGVVVLGLFVVSGAVEGTWGLVEARRWDARQWRQWAWVLPATLLALLLNPYGLRLVRYPLDMAFRQPLNIAHVQEWLPVNFHELRGKLVLLVLALLFTGNLLRRLRWRLDELLIVLFALYCGLTYSRFLFLFALAAMPRLAELLDVLPPYRPQLDRPLLNAVLLVAGTAFAIANAPSTRQLQAEVAERFPVDAVAYLGAHPSPANLLNDYNWGGYLGWRDPRLRVFIDSRVDLFEYAGVLRDYLALLELRQAPRLLDQYRIGRVLLPGGQPLSQLLLRTPGWRLAWQGRNSMLLERVTPPAVTLPAVALPAALRERAAW